MDVTPLEALTGRHPNVAGFRVLGSRAWALKPKKQQRKLEPRTDVGRFVGYAVGGKAYRILHDGADKVSERGDVLMEESPAKEVKEESSAASSAGPQLTPQMTRETALVRVGKSTCSMLKAEAETITSRTCRRIATKTTMPRTALVAVRRTMKARTARHTKTSELLPSRSGQAKTKASPGLSGPSAGQLPR